MRAALTALTGVVLVSMTAAAENWPQWRGADNAGSAGDADPPVTWSETRNVKWKTKLPGLGHATPVIWGDTIFVQTAVATGRGGPPEPIVTPGREVLAVDFHLIGPDDDESINYILFIALQTIVDWGESEPVHRPCGNAP